MRRSTSINFICWCIIFVCSYFESCLPGEYDGHLLPFGYQRNPVVDTDVMSEVPSPDLFFRDYYKKRKPVVLKHAAVNSRAFSLWTAEYLSENYGNATVRLDAKSEDSPNIPIGEKGMGLDTISSFLKSINTNDKYLVSQIPQPMQKDIAVPKCLSCEFLSTVIQEVHLFISSNGSKTMLHRDPYSNVHCLFNGTKNWILVHPKYTSKLYMSEESDYEWGGYSSVNVDAVDLHEFPMIQDVEISKVTLEKGDCIFMPGGYWHQVRIVGEMNTAVSIWLSRYEEFHTMKCASAQDILTLDQYPVIWTYSGKGDVVHGYMDIYVLQQALVEWGDINGKIDLRTFVDHFFILSEENSQKTVMLDDISKRKKEFLLYLDPQERKSTTVNAVTKLTVKDLKTLVTIVHPSEISNTERHEYLISGESIRKLMFQCIKEKGTFDFDTFRELYIKELGGTAKFAKELIRRIKMTNKDQSTLEEFETAIPTILKNYAEAIPHDPETERQLYKYLAGKGTITKHDEL